MESPLRRLWPLLVVFFACLGALHLQAQTGTPAPTAPVAAGGADFVGSERCASCHQGQHAAWLGSQHAMALQTAREDSVLGRFDGATFEKDGTVSTFLKRNGRFLIATPGPDGKPGEFEVKFTLGLEPLQQYLVELPGGRLQSFGIAWDTRPASAGGQRWFDLYPDQKLAPGSALHWTGIQQTANFMCIDCHVTNLRKGFDEAANAYHSTWSEGDVGCEACHGPGREHAADPHVRLPAAFPPRAKNTWGTDPATRPNVPAEGRTAELQVCARCHARRAQLTDDVHAGQPFADGFRASLLEHGLYHADGQMQDEVYNWGSFVQSRMFSKGVSCGDCHDVHSGKLKASGNAVCEQCHEAAKYDARTHHFHDPASKAGQCATCHMPVVTYMIVDPRHDHSFRVPRPDLAQSIGTPDVCATCHQDKPPGWTAEELRKRLGRNPAGFQTFAEAFDLADRGAPGAENKLARIANDPMQPAIVRASALSRAEPGASGIDLAAAFADPDSRVRRSAVELVEGSGDPSPWIAQLARLLGDPVREVRIEAVRALAGPAELRLGDAERSTFRKALDEFIAVQRYNADRGEAHMNLALLEIRRGNGLLADDHLMRAIAIDPTFVPAYLQLADLYRARSEEARAEQILRQAIGRNPDAAEAYYALGLSLVRQRRGAAALAELARAAEFEPATARFGYTYAVALDQAGDQAKALQVLDQVLARHPYDLDSLTAGAIWAMRRGDRASALRYLDTMQALRPGDPDIRRQIERLSR